MAKKTNSIMLTPEEIRNSKSYSEFDGWDIHKLLHAQAKKIKEWGDEPCPHKYNTPAENIRRRECPLYWQEAFKEVGE